MSILAHRCGTDDFHYLIPLHATHEMLPDASEDVPEARETHYHAT